MMENSIIRHKRKLIILLIALFLLFAFYSFLIFHNIQSLKRYDNEIMPSIYVEEFDMSHYTFQKAKEKFDYYKDYILSKEMVFRINSKEYTYNLKDLGIEVDMDKTILEIKNYQKKLSYSRKLKAVYKPKKKVFSFYYQVNDEQLMQILNQIKENTDVTPVPGYFDTSNGVSYVKGVPGYSFNVEKSISVIKNELQKPIKMKSSLLLDGDIINIGEDKNYESIDTLTSSFETPFMPNTYLRNINLNTALGYINGTVVEPGEVFSYCSKAGPFNKSGYVFYYEFVGNGVCQIATTVYNAALLGGLEIVKRYPHAKKSLYVAGGLDATVASYSSGWCVDMQFKNTYQYPIYIKAYSSNGHAYVEFWSNHDAKEGKEYTMQSVKIGQRGYRSYRHTFKDGEEIDVSEVATTWYTEE